MDTDTVCAALENYAQQLADILRSELTKGSGSDTAALLPTGY